METEIIDGKEYRDGVSVKFWGKTRYRFLSPEDKAKRLSANIALGIIGGLMLLCSIGALIGSNDEDGGSDMSSEDRIQSVMECESALEESAPWGIDFGWTGLAGHRFSSSTDRVAKYGGDVKVNNAFGAQVSHKFYCEWSVTGGVTTAYLY